MPVSNRQRIGLLLAAVSVLVTALVLLSNVLAGLLRVDPTWIMVPALLMTGLGSTIAVARQFGRARRLTALNQEAVALLNRGEADAAARIFETCIADAAHMPDYRRMFELNRAAAHLQQSAPEEALALTQPLMDQRVWEQGLATLRANLVAVHAFACGLTSRLDEARAVLEEHAPELSETQRGTLLSAQALVAARAGKFDVAATELREGWEAAEGVLPPRSMRALHVLSAFAAHELGDEVGRRRHLEAIADRPAAEFAYLADAWPEFAEFMTGRESYRQVAR